MQDRSHGQDFCGNSTVNFTSCLILVETFSAQKGSFGAFGPKRSACGGFAWSCGPMLPELGVMLLAGVIAVSVASLVGLVIFLVCILQVVFYNV